MVNPRQSLRNMSVYGQALKVSVSLCRKVSALSGKILNLVSSGLRRTSLRTNNPEVDLTWPVVVLAAYS